MKFNISTQHMKYGRKALDFALTQGYKRIGLLRKGLVLVRESLNRPVRDFQNIVGSRPVLSEIWKIFSVRSQVLKFFMVLIRDRPVLVRGSP